MNAGDKLHKEVAVKDLPEGYFKEQLMKLAATPETKVIVVASVGYANDWSCYVGWPLELSEEGKKQDAAVRRYYFYTFSTWEGVASNGDKFNREEAEQLFPECKHLNYRN
jgi:hypothetical protein